jgi:hypothetical protein
MPTGVTENETTSAAIAATTPATKPVTDFFRLSTHCVPTSWNITTGLSVQAYLDAIWQHPSTLLTWFQMMV